MMVGEKISNWKDVTSGVPQSTGIGAIGPLLFIININDIDKGLLCKISKFADDTKIGNKADMETQRNAIQNNLDKLAKCMALGRYLANDFQCIKVQSHAFAIGHGNPRVEYKINRESLQAVKSEKDLGVVISNHMITAKHRGAVERKCN